MVMHVVLGASEPKHSTLVQRKQVGKVDIGFIKDSNLACTKARTQCHHAARVVVRTFFDHGKPRKESLQVEPEMQLWIVTGTSDFPPGSREA